MFSFFKRHKTQITDYSVLHTDLHSHLIPGIDDGAKNMEDSLALVQAMIDLGFKKIITTPHIMAEYYPNTREGILSGLKEVQEALVKANIDIPLDAAAEYNIDDQFLGLLNGEEALLTLPGNRLLIEFSTFSPPSNWHEVIFQINTKGYRPILAHPERYLYFAEKMETFKKIKSLGCSLQLNLLSLIGHYGGPQKKLAYKLLKAGLVDFAATDMHRIEHAKILSKALKDRKLQRQLKNYSFKNAELA